MNENCYMGDHTWQGTSKCIHCGERLRCACGALIRSDNLEVHFKKCRVLNSFSCPGCCGEGVVENYSCTFCGGTGEVDQAKLDEFDRLYLRK